MAKTRIASIKKEVIIGHGLPTVLIGERINPAGKKKMADALRAGNLDIICAEALSQVNAGADIIDIAVGTFGVDEKDLLPKAVQAVMRTVDVPLCFDSAKPEALKTALKVYQGKALINSVNGGAKSLDYVLPLVKEYGAAVIGLTQDEQGIPADPDRRVVIAQKIIERAEGMGIPREEIIIDCLASAVGADQGSGLITLETIRKVKATIGVNITLGASNVSFGMPGRDLINNAFISAAISAGATSLIVDASKAHTAILAMDFILGQDQRARRYTENYRTTHKKKLQ
ncbi:MAG: dihydropteroate synthase [Thermodesulfobacteriota bacterium]|nr:dihydropteroate synthase [Thermodesulfobacteriota bacterium]